MVRHAPRLRPGSIPLGVGDESNSIPTRPIGYMADAPISNPDLDTLRRQPFANRIADTVATRTDPTSLVIGLYGQWGEGKTTVLEFVEKRLACLDDVVCVRFNPWLYQGESQLLLSFFETLASAIDRSLKTRKEEMGRWLRTLGTALGTVSVGIGVVNASPGSAMQTLGESLSSVDVQEKRAQLEGLLGESGKRILIMIDDIDRLDDAEIATVFKLVKLAADFSHTSYILAFDQDVVTKALSKRFANSERSGSSFIEKIVQVPIELPRADQGVLQSMTLQAMTEVLNVAAIELDDADLNRFSTVFGRYLGPHIGTPRMVKRIANAIEFAVPLVAGEVNTTDLLLIETLRVLFPQVHRKLPTVKDALLGKLFDYHLPEAEKTIREQLTPLFADLNSEDGEHVKGALRELFPRIERMYSNYHYGTESIPGWHAAQRICAPHYFDRYFSYGIPVGDLADSDLRSFLDHLPELSEEDAAVALTGLFEKASPKRVIEKLRPLETTFSYSTSRALACALATTSMVLPDPLTSPMAGISSAFGQAAMHIASMLVHMPSGERAAELRHIIETSASLPFASEVLRWSRIVSGDDLAPDARALTPQEIADLEVVLGERVAEEAAVTPLFKSMPKYSPTLYYDWLRGADRPPVEQHLANVCSGDTENALALVRAFMPAGWSLATGSPVESQVERNTYDSIAGLVDPQVLVDVFAAAFPSTVEDELPIDTSTMEQDERIALRWVRIHRVVQTQTPASSDGQGSPR
jgi:hypothetical protein